MVFLVRNISLLLFLLLSLSLAACVAPPAPNMPGSEVQSVASTPRLPAKPLRWSGVFSCTAHIAGKLPAITWQRIPFRQEGDRLTGLYTFTDAFNHRDSVVFSGALNERDARMTVTAVRSDGVTNFTADLAGSPRWLTGQMMTGTSARPVRYCTLAMTPT